MKLSSVDRDEFLNAVLSLKGIMLKADKSLITKSDIIKGYIKIDAIERIFISSCQSCWPVRLCFKLKRRIMGGFNA
jgi:hypothetical protein